ncbi:unnamed protein product [Peniophora sp. CBMAI 1063]|nr:unnamed protein product [Peniophora sp. CBMAI 1063]
MFIKSLRNSSRRTPPVPTADRSRFSGKLNASIRTSDLLALDDGLQDEAMDSDAMSVDSASSRDAPSSATSHEDEGDGDASTRSGSPAPSMYSMTDSIRASSYRHEFGRSVNSYSDVYLLPADEEELQRLDLEHILFQRLMGKYPPPMPTILAEDVSAGPKRVLDLGCGSGTWALEVAREFPHCEIVAVDLVPMQNEDMPDNCRSEVDDINLGLQHFFNDFDVVHARYISAGIRNYEQLVDHMAEALRPAGLIEVVEIGLRLYDHNREPIIPNLGDDSPHLARWMALLNMAVRQRGGSPDAADMLHEWMSVQPALEDVVYRDYYVPTSPFMSLKDPYHSLSELFREDLFAFLKSGRPLLLKSGLSESIVDNLAMNAHQELRDARTPTYIRVQSVYARKVFPAH